MNNKLFAAAATSGKTSQCQQGERGCGGLGNRGRDGELGATRYGGIDELHFVVADDITLGVEQE